MNKKLCTKLARLFAVTSSVPFPHDGIGAKTSSFKGFVDYQADMRRFIPLYKNALEAIICENDPDWLEGSALDHLGLLEDWVESRVNESWR